MHAFEHFGCDWELLSKNISAAHLKYVEGFALASSLSSKMVETLKLPINVDFSSMIRSFCQVLLEHTKPEKLIPYMKQAALMLSTSKNFANFFQHNNGDENKDKRFKDPEWHSNPLFSFMRDHYIKTSEMLKSAVDATVLDDKQRTKASFYIGQVLDALAPVNFPFLNPEVIRETLSSSGQNIVNGADNLLHDMKKACESGKFSISTTDDSFVVGENLAITSGKIVFQNELFQLIQYEASTKEVAADPILIVPAWINKYYILDLQPHNSLVKYIIDQGYTVFMISWVNPGAELAHKSFEDYMQRGVLKAIEKTKEISESHKVNCVGYCLGGTMLAVTLAYLAHEQKLKEHVSTATFLTTLIDFKNAGDVSVFIDEVQLASLETIMKTTGYLDGYYMALCFNMLRSNDMIWSYYINNYLLGKKPQPFDILHWNSDSTRMPYAMHSYYLRKLYLENALSTPNGIHIGGVGIDLSKIDIPAYILATKEDHIAPWESVYIASNIYSGNNRFVLGGSGHVAGIVNPPEKKKYSYRVCDAHYLDPKEWFNASKEFAGSWWPHWSNWVKETNKAIIKARTIDKKNTVEQAPGSYVKIK